MTRAEASILDNPRDGPALSEGWGTYSVLPN